MESYKRKFDEHLAITEELIKLAEEGDLSREKAKFQLKHRIEESLRHDYLVALDFWNEYGKFKQIEAMLKKYPKYYENKRLVPEYVVKMRQFGYPYFQMRKMKMKIKEKRIQK